MSDEQVVELLKSCTMKPEDIMQLEDIKSRMETLNEIEKRLRLIVAELRDLKATSVSPTHQPHP
jgi:tetrahydromethanopterin S-methyltransferase subunit G